MGMPHHAEPLVSGGLAVAVEKPPHPIDEDLGAAAGNAVETGGDEAVDDFRDRQPREPRDVHHLRRRERVQAERRIARFHRLEQIDVPLHRQIRVVAALEQQLAAAERDGLVDLPEDLLEPEHVALTGTDRPIERAEVAPRHADVRVVDVAVDDVGDDAPGMLAGADVVGKAAEQRGRRLRVQLQRFRGIDPPARCHLVRDGVYTHRSQSAGSEDPALRTTAASHSQPVGSGLQTRPIQSSP